MANIHRYYDVRTFLIYIDSYDNNIPVGRLYNPHFDEKYKFESLTQLLLKIEQSLDVENMPQASQQVRTFCPSSIIRINSWEESYSDSGKLATFDIEVLFRRNASWQGSIMWLEEGKKQNFRSVLELIVLINSALENKKNQTWMNNEEVYDKAAD